MTAGPENADPLVLRLRRLSQVSPDLREAAGIYEAVLLLLRDADLRPAVLPLTRDEARRKLEQGQPLLAGLDLELDSAAFRELTIQLAGAQERGNVNAGRIRQALEENRLDVVSLLPDIAAGANDAVTAAARNLELDPGLLWTITQNALKPALRAWCRQATPLAAGVAWEKGTCLICGATATLAELQGNEQVRHARCSACGAGWRVRRLQCLFCGNSDHRSQRYFTVQGGLGGQRVEVCDRCFGYLKVINAFDPTPPELLPVEDLATLHLDYIARERGYRRPVPSGGPVR
jgi:FdhE protein